ncbi:MAG: N-acetylmuramic acid 6-phosphate etherase [Verrucomicrobiales bacterium]
MPASSASPRRPPLFTEPVLLGIEGGGTRTTVALAGGGHGERVDFELGPSNLRQMLDRELTGRLREVRSRIPVPVAKVSAIAIGLAGTRTDSDRNRIRLAASRVFPRVPCLATDDLQTALAAAPAVHGAMARILVLSGTGSCCFGLGANGRAAKVGGRGHVIGDRGSACDIGLRALRELTTAADRSGRWPLLGALILDALCLNSPEDLIDWSMQAGKMEIAGLAVTVFQAAAKRDPLARRILDTAAETLSIDALACARRLARPDQPVQFVFNGGVLLKNPNFARAVGRRLRHVYSQATVTNVPHASVDGALELARSLIDQTGGPAGRRAPRFPGGQTVAPLVDPLPLASLRDSPTEARNPRSLRLDTMPLDRAVALMLEEEGRVPAALWRERKSILQVLEAIIEAFGSGGHLYYVGAGTSGRLGVLDASECPPTFGAPREQVQGIIAGGRQALWSAVEGAEDDAVAGEAAVAYRRVGSRDVVVGIAASGRTPFVWGALAEAARRRATTSLLCFNPAVKTARRRLQTNSFWPDVVIAPNLGAEVLTGSTRLKAGTATKLVLNLFTTLAMCRTGKVVSNLMIDLNPSNIKLRDRSVRIVVELSGASQEEAERALEASGWVVKNACILLKMKR